MTSDTLTKDTVRQDAMDRLQGLGLDADVRVLDIQQRQLRDNGFLVDIDVCGVSQFYCAVDWHLDLGIPKGDERRESHRLTPGRKCLVTDAGKFRSLETRVRANLDRYSFRIAMFGNYRYIPNTAFMEWHTKHQEIVAEFEIEKERLLDRYEDLVAEMQDAFRAMARETWLTLMSRQDEDTRAWVREHSITKFSDMVVARAMEKMPTVAQIDERLQIVLQPLATFLLADEQAAIELERERALTAAQELRMERDMFARQERAWTEKAEAESKAVQAESAARREAAAAEAAARARAANAEAEEQIRRAQAETAAIKAAQLEIARTAVKQMVNPFEEVIGDLRAQVYNTVTEVLDNIRHNGRVVGKTTEKIENLIALFALLHNPAVTPDAELESAIGALRSAMNVGGSGTKRSVSAIQAALTEVKYVAGNVVSDIAAETAPSKGGWEQLDL